MRGIGFFRALCIGTSIGLLLWVLMFWCVNAFGATYYIDPAGDDTTGDGSSGNPWATVQKGIDEATSAGDTVIVNDGTYTAGGLANTNSGTAANPITFQAANEGQSIIDISVTISGWSNAGEGANIYHSSDPTGVGGGATGQSLWKVGDDRMLVHVTDEVDLDAEDEFWHDGTNDLYKIYTTSDPTLSVYKGWDDSGFIAFHIHSVDWIILDGIVTQYSHIGIIIGSGVSGNGCNDITVQNCTSQYHSFWGMAAKSGPDELTRRPVFDTITIQYVDVGSGDNGHGFKFAADVNEADGQGGVIKNSTIHHVRFHGIQASNGWDDITINNNVIHDYGYTRGSGSSAGLRFGTTTTGLAYDNEIYEGDSPDQTGIYLQTSVNAIRIYRNEIYGNGWHGIYIFGSDSYDVRIYNNLIYDNDTAGIRFEAGGSNIFIENNTFDNNGTSANSGTGSSLNFNIAPSQSVTIKNNISYTTAEYGLFTVADSDPTTDYNLWYRSDGGDVVNWEGAGYTLAEYNAAIGEGANSVESNPLFTNRVLDNFTLQAGSPAREVAIPIPSHFLHDYVEKVRGAIWDIGAYESSDEAGVTVLSGIVLSNVTVN